MKVVIIFLSIIAFIICLVIGVYVGSMETHAKNPTPVRPNSPTQSPTIPTTENRQPTRPNNPKSNSLNQRTLVLIQADNLINSQPRLIGVWLAIYMPTQPQIIFLPLYPSEGGVPSPLAQALSDSFGFTPQGTLTLAFEQALQTYNFKYDGKLITDEEGLARIVDGLHGLDLGDGSGIRDGKTVSGLLALPWENSRAALSSQKRLLNGICARWASAQEKIDWLSFLVGAVPKHIRTDLSFGIFVDDWNTLTSTGRPIKCEIPASN